MMRSFLFLLLLISGYFAGAQTTGMTIVGIRNAFETVELATDLKSVKVYTGLTDNATCTSIGETGVCSSCASAVAPFVCNLKQMEPSGYLEITIRTDTAALFATGTTPAFKATINSSSVTIEPTRSTTISAGVGLSQDLTIALSWSSICSLLNAAGCTQSFTGSITVGISKANNSTIDESVTINVAHRYVTQASMTAANTTGYMTWSSACTGAAALEFMCGFEIYPGDEKAYLIDFYLNSANSNYYVPLIDGSAGAGGGTTDSSGQKYKYIRLYYNNTSFASLTPTEESVDLPIDTSSGAVTDKRILNLSNDVEYFFKSALVDQGGNATFFANDADLAQIAPGDLTAGVYKQSAFPGPVYGLLEGNKCFVATAAYGSEMAPQVESLRKFRDQFLLTHTTGRFLVKIHYDISPPLAAFIAEHESLRTLARLLLTPIVEFSEWAVGE